MDKAIPIKGKGHVFLSTKDDETSKSTIIRRIPVWNTVLHIANLKAMSSGKDNVLYTFQGVEHPSLNLRIRAKDGKMIAHKVRNCTRDQTCKKSFFAETNFVCNTEGYSSRGRDRERCLRALFASSSRIRMREEKRSFGIGFRSSSSFRKLETSHKGSRFLSRQNPFQMTRNVHSLDCMCVCCCC